MRRSLFADRRGGVAILAAVGGALASVVAGVVVDGGSVVLHARRYQAAADLSALAAARDIGHAQAAARATATDNLGPVAIETVTGMYRPDREIAPRDRFEPGVAEADAARVTVSGEAPLFFSRILGRDSTPITRTATAALPAARPLAMLSIGSRLARIEGGAANQVLSGLTGSEVRLTALDYRHLADARVDLLTYSDALATRLGLTAGDYEQLLSREIDTGDALRVLAETSDGADAALGRLARAAEGRRIRLSDLIGLETDSAATARQGLSAKVSALDLASALIEVGGERQVRLDLGAQAGLASTEAWLAIGERPNRSPWLAVTREGRPIIRTAQARLYLSARTAEPLAALGQADLPLLVELAASEARLDAVSCLGSPTASVGVRPGVGRVRLGQIDPARLDDFKRPLAVQPATLVSAGPLTVRASADAEAADAGFQTLRFSSADVAAQRTRTATSRGFASGAVGSLLQRLQVDVQAGGLGVGLGSLSSAVGRLISGLAPVLDGLIGAILAPLGVSLGEADVTVHGVSCPDRPGVPVLVG